MAGKNVPTHIKKICTLLKNDNLDYQCAAAMVLGEMKIKDSFVVKALGEVLSNGDDVKLKGHILDAFDKLRSKESLKYLMPFLFNSNTEHPEFSERAVLIASSLGVDSTKTLKAMLKEGNARERCIINSIFIKMRSLEGLKIVLESLQDQDESVVEEISDLMKEETKTLTADERKTFSAKVEDFLKDKKKVKSRHTLSAAIKILGYIACPHSQATMMAFTTLQNHPFVRSKALCALKDVMIRMDAKSEYIKLLISYLDERDFAGIVSPSMNILMNIPFNTRMADMVIKLLDNQHDAVRRFAIKKMRELNSLKVVRVLIQKLSSTDAVTRDLAAESLCWLDAARPILLDMILEEKNLELGWLFAKILKPHAVKFRANQIKRLSDYLNKLLDDKNPLQEPILFLLKTTAPDSLYESLLRRGKRQKQKKNFKEAVETLRILERNSLLNGEAKYDLALGLLKQTPVRDVQTARNSDGCLPLFQSLIRDGSFPLFEKLKAEKILVPDDLYFLATYFIDRLQKESEFANALLQVLVKKHPKSKAGVSSRKLIKENQS